MHNTQMQQRYFYKTQQGNDKEVNIHIKTCDARQKSMGKDGIEK